MPSKCCLVERIQGTQTHWEGSNEQAFHLITTQLFLSQLCTILSHSNTLTPSIHCHQLLNPVFTRMITTTRKGKTWIHNCTCQQTKKPLQTSPTQCFNHYLHHSTSFSVQCWAGGPQQQWSGKLGCTALLVDRTRNCCKLPPTHSSQGSSFDIIISSKWNFRWKTTAPPWLFADLLQSTQASSHHTLHVVTV